MLPVDQNEPWTLLPSDPGNDLKINYIIYYSFTH